MNNETGPFLALLGKVLKFIRTFFTLILGKETCIKTLIMTKNNQYRNHSIN